MAELRAVLLPGEIEAHVADAELHGPWDERRADYLFACLTAAVRAVWGGGDVSAADCLIQWNPATPVTVGWASAAAAMAAKCQRR